MPTESAHSMEFQLDDGSTSLSLTEGEFTELVQEIADDRPPRVFALIEELGTRECADLFAWGVEVNGRACVFGEDGRPLAQCASALSARKMFAITRNVWLAWSSRPASTGR